jgi:hypothetical protein
VAWIKQGLIFVPDGSLSWARTHASVPTVDVLSDRVWRIYYAARDAQNRCSISYFDVEAGNPRHIIYRHEQPILPLGKLGTFDDSGMMPSWIVMHQGVRYLYYTGWNVRQTVPYQNAIGLAVSRDGGQTFERYDEGPVLGLTVHEPYFTGTATVMIENGCWRNWYAVCTKWEMIDGRAEPFYHLKYAESQDGVSWDRRGIVAIDYKDEREAGIVRASVLKEDGVYKMWYATRQGQDYREDKTQSYRIGYAESADGIGWRRLDEQAGIDVSENGWDSEMVEYPCVIALNGRKYLFYNGNGFGRSGIGYAVWE